MTDPSASKAAPLGSVSSPHEALHGSTPKPTASLAELLLQVDDQKPSRRIVIILFDTVTIRAFSEMQNLISQLIPCCSL